MVKVRFGAKGKFGVHSVISEQPYTPKTQSRNGVRPVRMLARVGEHTALTIPRISKPAPGRVVCSAARAERTCTTAVEVVHHDGALRLRPLVDVRRMRRATRVTHICPALRAHRRGCGVLVSNQPVHRRQNAPLERSRAVGLTMSSPRRNKKLGSSAISADAVPAASATSASATGDGASILSRKRSHLGLA